MATKKYEKDCKKLVATIEDGINRICTTNKSFFVNFVAEKNETNSEEDNKKEGKTIEKMFQRVKRGEYCTKESLCKLEEIYKFLLDNNEYKKLNIYKPLLDDSFERSVLGDEHYEKLQTMAKEPLTDKKTNSTL